MSGDIQTHHALTPVFALLRKDLEQNAKALALITAIGLALGSSLQIIPSQARNAGAEGFLVGSIVLGLPILFSTWFISQERAKGTIQILRSLPVSGVTILFCKWGLAILYAAAATLCLEVVLPIFTSASPFAAPQRVVIALWITAAFMCISGIFFCLFLMLDQKIATQIAWVGATALFYALDRLSSLPGLQRWLATISGRQWMHIAAALGWCLPAALGAVFILCAGRYLDRTDLANLKEN